MRAHRGAPAVVDLTDDVGVGTKHVEEMSPNLVLLRFTGGTDVPTSGLILA